MSIYDDYILENKHVKGSATLPNFSNRRKVVIRDVVCHRGDKVHNGDNSNKRFPVPFKCKCPFPQRIRNPFSVGGGGCAATKLHVALSSVAVKRLNNNKDNNIGPIDPIEQQGTVPPPPPANVLLGAS